jgi:peptidoglycan/LPS O-acetylase OafA/YrhL
MVGAVTAVVVAVGVLAPLVPAVALLLRLTPQFAALFAVGVVCAGIVGARDRVRRLPWPWLAALAAAPVLVLVAVQGSVWTVHHYYWVDVALGPAVALLLVSVAAGRPAPLVWLLDTRAGRSLGSFSYSLYLIHAPLVVFVNRKLVAPHVAAGLPTFLATLAIAVPVSLVAARCFAAVFEIPFQRHRSWPALREAVQARAATIRAAVRSRVR